MPKDYYPDVETEKSTDTATGGPSSDPNKKPEDGETTLIPKSLFSGDVKPGDTITLKVVQTYEKDVQVCKTEGNSGKEGQPSESPDDELGDMYPKV